jgi:hypothetical protein
MRKLDLSPFPMIVRRPYDRLNLTCPLSHDNLTDLSLFPMIDLSPFPMPSIDLADSVCRI